MDYNVEVKLFDVNYSFAELIIYTDDIDIFTRIRETVLNSLSFFIPGYQFMPSFKRGLFDGKKKFFRIQNNKVYVPKGLSFIVRDTLKEKFNIDVKYDVLPNKINFDKEEFKNWIKTVKFPFKLRDYQLKMVVEALFNQRKILLAATGAGKSAVLYFIMRYLLEHNYRTILLVPAISLLEQMYSDFKEYMVDEDDETLNYVLDELKLIGGGRKDKSLDQEKLIISTYASARNIKPEDFRHIDAMLCDEAHLVKAEITSEILYNADSVSCRIGLTGTLPDDIIDRISLQSTIGEAKQYITPRELINRGLATDMVVNAIFLNYEEKVKKMRYFDEIEFIEEHTERNNLVCNITEKVSKKYGNTILLYNHTKHGVWLWKKLIQMRNNFSDEEIKELNLDKIKNNFEEQKKYKVFFINGSVKADVREKIRKILEEYNDAIVISLYKIMGTGINIKNLKAIVLGASTKSTTTIIQTIGRGLRKHYSKDIFRLYDIVDDFGKNNYMVRHFDARLKQYVLGEYKIDEKHFKVQKMSNKEDNKCLF